LGAFESRVTHETHHPLPFMIIYLEKANTLSSLALCLCMKDMGKTRE